jgi:transglutaminase-like putative cysteine protease
MFTSWREFSKPMRVIQEEWKRLFATLYGTPPRRVAEPFGSSLRLGGARQLLDTLEMDVEAPPGNRYYWRGAVYDHYDGTRWTTYEQERVQLVPDQVRPDMERYELRETVTQAITRYVPGFRTLVGASQLRTVDRDAEALVDLSEGVPLEYMRVFSVQPLDTGDQYRVRSEVSTADLESLRGAGTDYPEWVTGRYLKLPTTLPTRVRDLAEAVTVELDTPLDKAMAIEQYLRRNITYNLDPPPAHEGRDYVDFLLFESREDYCNGYASAMVVMARSVGIPARMGVGYAQGEYDPERQAFRVRKENAHSWPEIYFPRYGWLEFEPTASEEPIVRPQRPPEASIEEGSAQVPPWLDEDFLFDLGIQPSTGSAGSADWAIEPIAPKRNTVIWVAGLVLGLVATGGAGWWALENVGLHRLTPVERAYARLLRFGSWLFRPPRVSDTPREWADTLGAAAPEAGGQISQIVALYVRARFAKDQSDSPDALTSWRCVRPMLWRSWLRRLRSRVLGSVSRRGT